jgi:hypothetical protein
MLWVSTDIQSVHEFRELFRKTHENVPFLDLSKLQLNELAVECESIVNHHKSCVVFLGYLEPGWMLDPAHQTRIRKLFRKFPVAFLSFFLESLPYSWKTETEFIYTKELNVNNGIADSVDDGSIVHNKPKNRHHKTA